MSDLGTILILNGTPRSGKSSIAAAIQRQFPGVWVNLGVDSYMRAIPEQLQPGIGLRPGGERPDLEAYLPAFYLALYESIAAHSRLGLNVVAGLGHHDAYSSPLRLLPRCAAVLQGLPALLVGVRCPLETIMKRREATWGKGYEPDGSVPRPVALWQDAVHAHGVYDLEVDTSLLSPEECAEKIRQRMYGGGPYLAMERLSALLTG